jgi:hypothetical protein
LKSNAGFVGFDGTENERTILALQQVKKAAGSDEHLNILLRQTHGRARSITSKFNRMFGVKAFASNKADKEKWEKAGTKIECDSEDFVNASDFVFLGTLGEEESSLDCLRKLLDLAWLDRESAELLGG